MYNNFVAPLLHSSTDSPRTCFRLLDRRTGLGTKQYHFHYHSCRRCRCSIPQGLKQYGHLIYNFSKIAYMYLTSPGTCIQNCNISSIESWFVSSMSTIHITFLIFEGRLFLFFLWGFFLWGGGGVDAHWQIHYACYHTISLLFSTSTIKLQNNLLTCAIGDISGSGAIPRGPIDCP